MRRRRVQHRTCALHEQVSEIGITALADVAQGSCAGGVLTRHQADPGGELPAVFEFACVAHGGDDGQGSGGPDAADLHQALRRLAEFGLGFDLPVVADDTFIEYAQLIEQITDRAACELGQVLGRRCPWRRTMIERRGSTTPNSDISPAAG